MPTVQRLATFVADETGDLATVQGVEAWLQRVKRRLTTRRGRFLHLPDYGVQIPASVKTLSRPGAREALAIDAEDQIRREPETRSVSVSVRVDANVPNLIWFDVNAIADITVVRRSIPVTV